MTTIFTLVAMVLPLLGQAPEKGDPLQTVAERERLSRHGALRRRGGVVP